MQINDLQKRSQKSGYLWPVVKYSNAQFLVVYSDIGILFSQSWATN